MGSMVIRNIPDEVLARLKERARIAGKSTEQLAREALAEKAKPSREEIIGRMEAIRASAKRVSGQQIIDEIRSDRENNLGKDLPGLDNDN
jgi:plasmid stability protein